MKLESRHGAHDDHRGDVFVSFTPDCLLWPAVDDVGNELLDLADASDHRPFRLDFGNVTYMSGAGLEKLVLLNVKLKMKDRPLVLQNVNCHVRDLFKVTGLADEFHINPADSGRLRRHRPAYPNLQAENLN